MYKSSDYSTYGGITDASSDARPQKKKNMLLFGGIALAVVAVALIVVLVILPMRSKGEQTFIAGHGDSSYHQSQTFMGDVMNLQDRDFTGDFENLQSQAFMGNVKNLQTQAFMGDAASLQRLQTSLGNPEGFSGEPAHIAGGEAHPIRVSSFIGKSFTQAALALRKLDFSAPPAPYGLVRSATDANVAVEETSNFDLSGEARVWLDVDDTPGAYYLVKNAPLLAARNAVPSKNSERVEKMRVRSGNTYPYSYAEVNAGQVGPFLYSDMPLLVDGKPQIRITSSTPELKTATVLADALYRDMSWIYSYSIPEPTTAGVLRHYYTPNPKHTQYSQKSVEVLSNPEFSCPTRMQDLASRLQNIGDFEDQLNLIQYAQVQAEDGAAANLGAGFSVWKMNPPSSDDKSHFQGAKNVDLMANLDKYLNRFTGTSADTDYVSSGAANSVGDHL